MARSLSAPIHSTVSLEFIPVRFSAYIFSILNSRGSYYISLVVCTLGEQGLWLGIMCGLVVQMLLLLSITLCTNWNQEVSITSF
jgi:hypothetical protein